MVLAAVFVAVPAAAQDQRFALRFGFVLVEPKDDTFDTQGGFEVDFEWYFAPRVGFEVASLGSANADFDYNGDRVTGLGFSTFTVGINGHVVRTEKADFGLGVFGGRATYTDFEFEDSSGRWDAEGDTVYGAQAFVDMTVGRKWAVNLGLRYIDTQLELDSSNELDFSPIVLRVMGVYRWGRYKKSQSP
jgi:hypothetical protein